MSGRFDYIAYDQQSAEDASEAKGRVESLERFIDALPATRAASLALTKLEECYMWIGKAIRDDQVLRTRNFDKMEKMDANQNQSQTTKGFRQ